MTTKLDYLQRYMSNGNESTVSKPKKKKKKRSTTNEPGTLVIDGDHEWKESSRTSTNAVEHNWQMDVAEEAPVVLTSNGEEIDIQDLPVFVNAADYQDELEGKTNKVVSSPPKQQYQADDLSPPRRGRSSQRGSSSDNSPPRRSNPQRNDEDMSPPRRGHRSDDYSSSLHHDEKTYDTDASPPRKPTSRRRAASDSDSDASPPRRRANNLESISASSRINSRSPPQPRRRVSASESDEDVTRRPTRKFSDSETKAKRIHRTDSMGRDISSPHHRRSRSRDHKSRRSTRRRGESRSRSRQRSRRRSASRSRSTRRGSTRQTQRSLTPDHRRRLTSPRHRQSRSNSPTRRRERNSRSRSSRNVKSPENAKRSDRVRSSSAQKLDRNETSLQVQETKKDEYKARAGLFTTEEFAEDLKNKLASQQTLKAKPADMGQNAETVYRDKKGRKLDMLNEMIRQQEILEGKREREKKEEYEWGTGRVQKEQKKSQMELMEQIKSAPFARHADDEELEKRRRERVRAFDPINSRVFLEDQELNQTKKKKKKSRKGETKPKYSGPPAPSNRFGIQPGYRWDGVVRGTLWEETLMTRENSQSAKREDAYKYAVADM